MSRRSLLAVAVSALLIGFVGGFFLAFGSAKVLVEVDYDSAATRQVFCLGPFRIRTDAYRLDYLGHVGLPNGLRGLTGIADWQVAMSFAGASRVSPNYEAGSVINSIALIEPWLLMSPSPERAAAVKEQFLRALAAGGVHSADDVARRFDQEMLDAAKRQ